ncbi:NAD(P)/FAD-dependent oxidoreductase [Paenibacillus sp. N3.4]|uniref:NAD(P)/FAD-dependent oxidoreductase n=1 Tax=Paenibacillus sp. N3.4 TaxID=2603222 RepID=UPI0011C9C37E|nr:NAD(P)/FAD-dependent oxidoreductase [Paenibacillus sp. N3.4]TXK73863.1 NAD(P)/FAD-dependent oxidoreductase [Paenibacillus sp. N3.4]
MNHSHDVAVLGAGIAGSCLAKSLADQGWDTVLIDRKQFPRHKVCGEFLSPESQNMLNDLGLGGIVEALQPSIINRTQLIFNFGTCLEIPLPGMALGVSRYSLDSALHLAAQKAGVNVQTSTTVTSVYPCDSGYTIEAKQGGERKGYQVRAVIAAWGANGRSGLLGQSPDSKATNTYMGVKSHYTGIEMEQVVELYFFDGGYLGISPIEGGRVNAAALLKQETFKHTEKSILGLIEAASRKNPKLHQRMANALPVLGTQSAVAPVNLERKPLTWDRIPYVGDASMMIPPLCGDGMSMALRSALICAPLASRYLGGEISLDRWQQEYSQSIKREFKRPLQWGRFLQWSLGVPILPRALLVAAHVTPRMAYGLVKATRLKEMRS